MGKALQQNIDVFGHLNKTKWHYPPDHFFRSKKGHLKQQFLPKHPLGYSASVFFFLFLFNLSFGFISLKFREIFLMSCMIFFEKNGFLSLFEKKSMQIARRAPELQEKKPKLRLLRSAGQKQTFTITKKKENNRIRGSPSAAR